MTDTGNTKVILFGASGHGRVVADIISKLDNFDILGFADDRADAVGTHFFNHPVLGGRDAVEELHRQDPTIAVILAVGNNSIRHKLMGWLDEAGIAMATVIHPSAIISSDVEIGDGTVIVARAVVNATCRIGRACLVNTAASVDHDCNLGDCTHIAPGARLCGGVTTGKNVLVGAGAIVIPMITLNDDVTVGAGASVIQSVQSGLTVVGVPALQTSHTATPTPEFDRQSQPYHRKSPNELNILLTCAGRRVEMVREFQRSLHALGLQGNVLVSDVSDFSASMNVADQTLSSGHARTFGYFDQLKKLIEKNSIHLLVPMTDWDIRILARHQKQLQDIGCDVMIGNNHDVDICRSKLEFSRFLESKNLPFIPTQELQTFKTNPFYPCFAKLHSSSGSIGAAKIDSPTALKRHLAEFGEPMLIQPFIDGQEFTVDVYKARNGEVKVIIPRKRLRIRSGEVEQGITINDPDIIEATRALAEAFDGLWGIFCCQFRKNTEGQVYPIEINPRFGGGAPLSIAAGANLPLYLLQDILGLEITTDGSFQGNLLMMRYSAAKFTQVQDPESLPGFDTPLSL